MFYVICGVNVVCVCALHTIPHPSFHTIVCRSDDFYLLYLVATEQNEVDVLCTSFTRQLPYKCPGLEHQFGPQ